MITKFLKEDKFDGRNLMMLTMWQARYLCGKDKSLNVSIGKAYDL